jgi:hypothetical protein
MYLYVVTRTQRGRINPYSSNSSGNDSYVELWNKKIFLPVCNKKINYLVAYHYITKFPYNKKSVNIILDSEPADLSQIKADVIISTKKEKIPNIPYTYVPYFAWSFVEKSIDPIFLIKDKDERILKTKFCCFMYSNCNDKTYSGVKNRKDFYHLFQKLSNNKVDNLGRCYNDNYKYNGGWTKNNSIYNPYKFVIAFENQQLLGYISEKLTLPMLSRAIPIYLGAPDVDKYFNKKSFINVSDFSSFEECIKHVLKVDTDENLYNSYMKEPYLYNNKIDKDDIFSVFYGGKVYRDIKNMVSPYGVSEFIRPCNLISNNIRFITFSDGKKYKNNRILREAEESGFFKEIYGFDKSNLDDFHTDFIKNNPRGYGYWIWKSFLILKNLQDLEENDILVYLDSGFTINPNGYKRLAEYFEMLQRSQMIVFKIKYDDKDWIKMDALKNILNYTNKLEDLKKIIFEDPKSRCSGISLYRKTSETLKFANSWYELCCNYHNIDDSESIESNFPNFKEHRHDQSVFSILSKLIDCSVLDDNYNDGTRDFLLGNGEYKPFIPSRIK